MSEAAEDRAKPQPRIDLHTILILGGITPFVWMVDYVLKAHSPRDRWGYMLGRDFVNYWMGGRAALRGAPGDLFHIETHQRLLQEVFGPLVPMNWSYPPSALLFLWPLGLLDYGAALAAWSLVGYLAYLAAAATFSRSPRYLLLVALAPVVTLNLYCGQNGLFTAAGFLLILRYLDERPFLAGAVLGLFLCKPQLVVLFPLALLLRGKWKAMAAAGLCVAALAGATALVFGPGVWRDYFHLVVPVQQGVMNRGTGFLTMMPTGFMQARMLGASPALAWMVQAPFSLLALAVTLWTFGRRRDPLLSGAILITASFVVSPYVFNYDMVVFGGLMALLWPRLTSAGDRALLIAIWLLPQMMMVFGAINLPLAAPLMAAFLLRLAWLARDGHQAAPAALQPFIPTGIITDSFRHGRP